MAIVEMVAVVDGGRCDKVHVLALLPSGACEGVAVA